MTPPSRSLRLMWLTAALVAWLAIAVSCYPLLLNAFSAEVQRQFRDELARHLEALLAALPSQPQEWWQELSDPRWHKPYSGWYWQIESIDAQGKRLRQWRSRSLWDTTLALPTWNQPQAPEQMAVLRGPRGEEVLALGRVVITEGQNRWRVAVAAERAPLQQSAAAFARELRLVLALVGLLMALALALPFWWSHRVLTRLSADLKALQRGERLRLGSDYPRELLPLTQTVNQVLDQHAAALEAMRRQTANMAHAVKTPLAAALQSLTVARRDDSSTRTPHPAQAPLEQALGMVQRYLARVRTSISTPRIGQRADLAHVLTALSETIQTLYASRALRWEQQGLQTPAWVMADERDLYELFGALLDNAAKYAVHHVCLSLQRLDAGWQVVISDDGPGIPPERYEEVLCWGLRLDEQPQATGLGLTVAAELAHQLGGQLRLGRDPRLGGLAVTVQLPGLAQ